MSEHNIEFSSDENCLIVRGGRLEGKYNAVKSGPITCGDCDFLQINLACALGGVGTSKCTPPRRLDGQAIIWQKAEPKQDNKKATAVFSDNETVLKISNHGKHDGTYEAKENDGCWGCFFYQCTFDFMLGGRKCISSHRQDNKSIIWIKKENTEMTEAPAPAPAPALQHRHFDLIVAWAKNPTQPVWFWNVDEWQKAEYVVWHMEHYAIGEKPTEPPVKMVKYDGGSIEFPEPARVELERDTHYWVVTIYGTDHDYWTGHSSDFELLDNGLIQLTKEGAEKQSEALVELLKNHAQKWG